MLSVLKIFLLLAIPPFNSGSAALERSTCDINRRVVDVLL